MNEREKLAQWMIDEGYTTGHGDTVEQLLKELKWQIKEQLKNKDQLIALLKEEVGFAERGYTTSSPTRDAVAAEREACAQLCENMGIEGYGTIAIGVAIRARGEE